MAATAATRQELRGCDGFRVESPVGEVGRVEEVWLGPAGEPAAVALRTADGRRALLLAEDVAAVDGERGWVVARPGAALRELDLPRMDGAASAAWRTTGVVLPLEAARPRGRERGERPLWQVIGVLYAGLVALIAAVIALSFAVSYLVTGSAY